MIVFIAEITAENIERYLSTRILPGYFQNMKLKKVRFDPSALRGGGKQPFTVTYSVPGRVEDFQMTPEEHAFPILRSVHPDLQIEKVSFVPASALWTWNQEKMRIFFQPNEVLSEPSGEVFSDEEAYISISRKQIFLSFEIIQEYLASMLAALGVEISPDSTSKISVQWNPSIGAVVYNCGSVSVQLFFTDENSICDVLRFLGLDVTMRQLETWVKSALNNVQVSKIEIQETGIRIPLIVQQGGER